MYPSDIRPLTSLRICAALWVLVYHFRNHLGLGLDEGGATIVSWATLRSNGSRTGSSGGAAHAVAKCQPPPAGGDRRSAIP